MFYAFDNVCGIGMRYANTNDRYGHLRIFDTRKERDEWVESDRFDGTFHREALTYREALPYLVSMSAAITRLSPSECRKNGSEWMVGLIRRYESLCK